MPGSCVNVSTAVLTTIAFYLQPHFDGDMHDVSGHLSEDLRTAEINQSPSNYACDLRYVVDHNG